MKRTIRWYVLWKNNSKENSSLRLCFANAPENKLDEGIKRLSKIFNL